MEWVRQASSIVESGLPPGPLHQRAVRRRPRGDPSSYGDAKLERLRALKRAWDPTNVFHMNHNVAP